MHCGDESVDYSSGEFAGRQILKFHSTEEVTMGDGD